MYDERDLIAAALQSLKEETEPLAYAIRGDELGIVLSDGRKVVLSLGEVEAQLATPPEPEAGPERAVTSKRSSRKKYASKR